MCTKKDSSDSNKGNTNISTQFFRLTMEIVTIHISVINHTHDVMKIFQEITTIFMTTIQEITTIATKAIQGTITMNSIIIQER